MTRYMVYQNEISKVNILRTRTGYGWIVKKGNEILCVPIEANVKFFNTEEEAYSFLSGDYFVVQ